MASGVALRVRAARVLVWLTGSRSATVESFIQVYARRYSDHDPDAVTELCLYPSWSCPTSVS